MFRGRELARRGTSAPPPPRLHYEMPQLPAPVAVTATGSLTFPNPGATSMKSGEQGTPIAGLGVAFELSWESTK